MVMLNYLICIGEKRSWLINKLVGKNKIFYIIIIIFILGMPSRNQAFRPGTKKDSQALSNAGEVSEYC